MLFQHFFRDFVASMLPYGCLAPAALSKIGLIVQPLIPMLRLFGRSGYLKFAAGAA
jgi:hypothetical protein